MATSESLLDCAVSLPQHVVYRTFVKETVVLNLQTGKYHGLNPTGGRMLQLLEKAPTVREAAAQLADEYAQPVPDMERDVTSFCENLLERGLLETSAGNP